MVLLSSLYLLPITYLLTITIQRVLYTALIEVDLGNIVFVNMLTFLGMVCIGVLLWFQIPKGWAHNIGPWNWLILLAFCEASGNALMIITLSNSNLTFQTIISRGCEFVGVVMLSYFMSSSLESHISKTHMLYVFTICLFSSVVLPIIASFFVGSLSFWVVLLVACRSAIFAVATVGEQVLVQNFAVHPYTVLITEAIGGAIVTLAVLWPLGHVYLDSSLDQLSLSATWEVFTSNGVSAAVAVSFFIMVAIANASRVFVVRSTTALTTEVIALIQPSLIFIIMYVAYPVSSGGFGEKFDAEEFGWMLACFFLTVIASVLYFIWNKRKRQLFKLGLEAQQAAGMDKMQIDALDFICISGRELPRSMLGCYAGREADYKTFFLFFERVAVLYHEIAVLPNGPDVAHDPMIHNLPERLSSSTLAHVRWTQFSSVRFRVSRNIAGFDFSPIIKAQDRCRVLDLARKAIGSFQIFEHQRLRWVETALADCHSEWPHREYDCMEMAGILREWPESRAKFQCTILSDTGHGPFEIGVFVNEEDHFRFFTKAKAPTRAIVQLMYSMLRGLVDHVASQLPFSYHSRFGYLQTCPSNLGTGFKISLQGISGLTRASELRLGIAVDEIIRHALQDYIEVNREDNEQDPLLQ